MSDISDISRIDCPKTSPTEAKNDFFNLLEQVAENQQVFIVDRPEGKNVALIAESELASLMETVYLLRTPANAKRLFDALEESKSGKIQPQTIEELKQELGIKKTE